MVDTRTPEQRRRIMQSVKTKNTGPELVVRRALFAAGYRYRIHRRDLPGSPDIVFPSRRKAIFVHGCFWHGHNCKKGRPSKSKIEYWGPKIENNRQRDEKNYKSLLTMGWDVKVIWQCEIENNKNILAEILDYVDSPTNPIDISEPKE
ncbi:very short patch repair endonuclease [Roseococcus sp. YIM B11640]|uniref:very short patch repair endonuclease n=1 Tax=Roseococcus sp. YIM B11640 TaxID=3133973 RepID=UPI003C7B01EE